ncbi:MAG TPA: PDZ domain-containing protein [Vicinamibacterales bacterium]|nr:PDZ domain-containing protein [Vicinamibacterales bacterium]
MPKAHSLRPVLLFFLLLWATPAFAQTLEPIRYTVSFPALHTHYVEVEAAIPTGGRAQIDLMMAVWTPGSYLVREYARHVEAVTATDPAHVPLRVEKTRKNRWRVTTNGSRTFWLRYRVYAHEMSVRTNWVDEEFALLNGAPTFITLLESPSRRAHEVRVQLPRGWSKSLSGMSSGVGENTYVAPDYDTLVDSPILAGNPAVYEFRAAGKPHYLVDFRERGVWNGSQVVRDLAKIAEATARFWGDAPFDRYYFFNVIGSPLSALEHKNAAVMNTPRDSTGTRDAYLGWLGMASHEYFHAWNVKRLRPIELGPFDYENEAYTRSLWFAEGVTDYYGDLLLPRAGVATREEYLGMLSTQIRQLQVTPGRLEQSAESASYDAWIKHYRPDENSANSSISYYVKGGVIGFVLDAKLRRMTAGARSLDDVMRLMHARFSGETGFAPEDLRAVIASVAGPTHAGEMRAWLARTLETTAELDYTEALDWFGLRLGPSPEAPRPWLGLAARTDDQRTIVSHVRRDSPAFAAGVSVGDEITAIDGEMLPAGQLTARIGRMAPGARIKLSLSRDTAARSVEITLGTDPGHAWMLSVSPAATPAQSRNLRDWLRSR